MLRNYKIHLNQVFHSYQAANANLSEGKGYEESMEKLMNDLDVVFYTDSHPITHTRVIGLN